MDKRVLLVLLCVQVFLLIADFTATDAAPVEGDDQMPPVQVERKNGDRQKRHAMCGEVPGACSPVAAMQPSLQQPHNLTTDQTVQPPLTTPPPRRPRRPKIFGDMNDPKYEQRNVMS